MSAASPRRSRRLALALLTLGSCEPSGAPSRVPGGAQPIALDVPYPIADAERVEGAGRQALHDARFVFVGGVSPVDGEPAHALPELVEVDGPVVIAHHVEPLGPDTSTWQRLRRLAFGRVEPPRARAVPVPADELEALGFAPPVRTVWLVGPRGTCRADVGEPRVGVYDGAHETIVIGYRLEHCPEQPWAQVGIVADAIPVDYRWVPAESSAALSLPYGKPWDDPLAPLAEAPAWTHPTDPFVETIHLREIPGVEPRVVQLHRSWLDASPAPGERDWCDVEVASSRIDGWYNGRWIDPIPWDADAVGPFMLGAFVNGPQVDAVLYDDRFDGLVVVPPGPLEDVDDPKAWRQVFVPTQRFDRETLGRWGIRPARGPEPVGPACSVVDPV